MRLIILMTLITLLAGCSASPPLEPISCGDATEHPFERRCLDETGDNEVCTTWLGDGARQSQSVFCHASTDGQATMHLDFGGSGQVTVYVRNDDGDQLMGRTLAPGEHTIHLDDKAGRWRLVTDYSQAVGPARTQLWG